MATGMLRSEGNRSARWLTFVTALALATAALFDPSPARAMPQPAVEEFVCPEVFVGEDFAELGIARPGRRIFVDAAIYFETWVGDERQKLDIEDDSCELLSDGGFTLSDVSSVTLRLKRGGESLAWTYLDASFAAGATSVGFPEDLDWIVSGDGKDVSADFDDFEFLEVARSYTGEGTEGFIDAPGYFGTVFLDLGRAVPSGVVTIEVEVTFSRMVEGSPSTRSFLGESDLRIVRPDVPEVAPAATVSCSAPVVGAPMTCDLRSDPGVDFVWQASTNPVFASGVVTTDGTGAGQFAFTVPVSALGQQVLVEIVAWTAATPVGIASGPVPTSVPSGGGPRSPVGAMLLGAVLLGAVLLPQSADRRARTTCAG